MRVQAGGQGLLLRCQVLLLLQEFLLLGDQATDYAAQFVEFFLEGVDGFLRGGLLVVVVTAEALQQGFGLVIRMLVAAANRAGLIVL